MNEWQVLDLLTGAEIAMDGNVCLVTGGTSGIGEVTARELARKGATVVLVGRDTAKAEATVERIRRETGQSAVTHLIADLSSQSEIRRLAREFQERHARLDVLINNAGAMFDRRAETVDGIERTFALNHLAYFLLTELLIETLKTTAGSRVINVASMAHLGMRLDFDDLEARRGYSGYWVYGRSKLANILFTRELARRLDGSGVTANCLHPGFVATNFVAGNGFLGWVFRRLASVAAIDPEAGARTTVYLASSPEVAGLSGRFFVKCKESTPSAQARDDAAARKLWDSSEAIISRVAANSV